jgi:hypothetical protein
VVWGSPPHLVVDFTIIHAQRFEDLVQHEVTVPLGGNFLYDLSQDHISGIAVIPFRSWLEEQGSLPLQQVQCVSRSRFVVVWRIVN